MVEAHLELARQVPVYVGALDVFFNPHLFGLQRKLLVSLEQRREFAQRGIEPVKGSKARWNLPMLPEAQSEVAGVIKYPSAVAIDLVTMQERLRGVCEEELGVRTVPRPVTGFTRSGDGRHVIGVTTDDGAELACDAVVLAAGAETPRLLRQAGGGPLLPVCAAAELVLDVLMPKRNQDGWLPTGSLPEQSGILASPSGPVLANFGSTVRIAGLYDMQGRLGRLHGLDPPVRPSHDRLPIGPERDTVADRWVDQLYKWGTVKVHHADVADAWIGEAAVTPDGVPFVGAAATSGAKAANVWLCAGLGPSGGSVAIAAAQIVAEQSLHRDPVSSGCVDADHVALLSPSRFWTAEHRFS